MLDLIVGDNHGFWMFSVWLIISPKVTLHWVTTLNTVGTRSMKVQGIRGGALTSALKTAYITTKNRVMIKMV